MKTNVIFCGLFSLLLLAGCQSNQATPESTPAPATTSTSTGQQTTSYWEVKVKNGNKSTQVKLNSQTGEVLATENDD